MKLSNREKVLLGILLVLSLVYAYYNFAFKPGKIAKENLLQENRVLKSMIESGETAKTQNTGMVQKITEIAKLGNELMLEVPARAGVPETVAFLKKTALDANVDIKSLNYAASPKNKNNSVNNTKNMVETEKVRTLDYNITVQGAYNNLLAFLLKIENAPRLYTINDCQMTANAPEIAAEALAGPLQSSMEAGQGTPSPRLPSIPKGSAVYDGNDIKLKLRFSAYYDEEGIPGFTTAKEDEVPAAAGRINPFIF